VHFRTVVTEQDLVEHAKKLQEAMEGGTDALKAFAEDRTGEDSAGTMAGWKALLSLFKADSRDELVTLLGFSKSEIAARVAQAVNNLKAAAAESLSIQLSAEDIIDRKVHEPVVSFTEPVSGSAF